MKRLLLVERREKCQKLSDEWVCFFCEQVTPLDCAMPTVDGQEVSPSVSPSPVEIPSLSLIPQWLWSTDQPLGKPERSIHVSLDTNLSMLVNWKEYWSFHTAWNLPEKTFKHRAFEFCMQGCTGFSYVFWIHMRKKKSRKKQSFCRAEMQCNIRNSKCE